MRAIDRTWCAANGYSRFCGELEEPASPKEVSPMGMAAGQPMPTSPPSINGATCQAFGRMAEDRLPVPTKLHSAGRGLDWSEPVKVPLPMALLSPPPSSNAWSLSNPPFDDQASTWTQPPSSTRQPDQASTWMLPSSAWMPASSSTPNSATEPQPYWLASQAPASCALPEASQPLSPLLQQVRRQLLQQPTGNDPESAAGVQNVLEAARRVAVAAQGLSSAMRREMGAGDLQQPFSVPGGVPHQWLEGMTVNDADAMALGYEELLSDMVESLLNRSGMVGA